jgi:hypothetical protein
VEELDSVQRYAAFLGFPVQGRTVLVEGSTDVELLRFAAQIEHRQTGIDLLGDGVAIVAAGIGDLGGTGGVIRELLCLRGLARTCLLPSGHPRYRFIGLFDNDKAGRQAVRTACALDSSMIEYRDVFRMWPIMPRTGSRDAESIRKTCELANAQYKGLEWELEDLLPESFLSAFVSEYPDSVVRTSTANDKVHRDLTRDGKSRLHQFVKKHAMRSDLEKVIDVLLALRFYLGIR